LPHSPQADTDLARAEIEPMRICRINCYQNEELNKAVVGEEGATVEPSELHSDWTARESKNCEKETT